MGRKDGRWGRVVVPASRLVDQKRKNVVECGALIGPRPTTHLPHNFGSRSPFWTKCWKFDTERLAPAPRLSCAPQSDPRPAGRPQAPHSHHLEVARSSSSEDGSCAHMGVPHAVQLARATPSNSPSRHLRRKGLPGKQPDMEAHAACVGRRAWRRCAPLPPCDTGTLRSYSPGDRRCLYCGPRHP